MWRSICGDTMKLDPRPFDDEVAVPFTRLAYSVAEACEASGIGRTTLYDLIKSGKLVARKCGRRTVILVDDLAAALKNLPKSMGEVG